tara:strand:- start:3483 stop:13592 length:10110 start_codon:yes stop_codon:yes gene_type:complete
MKKLYTLILSVLTLSLNLNAQLLEDFTNSNATSSYTDNSFVGNSSVTWSYVKSRNANGDDNASGISLPALMLQKQSVGSKVTSSSISGGISDFSVKLYKGFTGGGNRQVELFVNGVSKGTSTPFDDFTEHIFSVSGINVSGNVVIELVNITSKQVIVDDISVTNYTAPTTATINLNTTGGSYYSERWANITTGINNTGTEVWGQNSCTFSSYTASGCRGALVNTDVSIAPGTYYVNCFDSYGDGWGNGNNFTVTAYGSTLASAYVGDLNASGNNLEVSLMIVVVAPPSCLPPTALTATNLTATSADLGWTAGGTETYWELTYAAKDTTPGSVTSTLVPMVNPNPTTSLTGLTANTAYDFYVKADCGFGTGSTDLSAWAGPYTFTTPCLSVSTFPYLESFETITSGQPDCWSLEGTTTTASYHFSSFVTGQTGRGMRFNSYNNSNGRTSELITPEIDASALTTLELAFQFKNPAGGDFEILISNDGGSTFTSLESGLTGQSSWTPKNYDLTSYISNSMKVKFKGTSNWANGNAYIYLDEVLVREIPNCLEPTALAPSNETSTSADFTWTAGGTENAWNVEYGADAFVPGSGTTIGVTTNTYSITGLTANTDYDIYLQADCGFGTATPEVSPWVGPISFTTLCGNSVLAPYIENFDGGFPNCWSQSTTDDGNWTLDASGTLSGGTGPSDDITGSGNYLYTEASGATAGHTYEINTDTIDLSSLSSPQVRFYSHMYGSATGTLNVDVTNDNGATYTNIFTKSGDQGNQWNEELMDLNLTGNVSFKITVIMGTSYLSDIAIDNFEIRESPPCKDPTGLAASNITSTTADITWAAGGTETVFNFEYGPTGYNQVSGISSVIDASTTIAANPNSLFGATVNASWPHVFTACLIADGNTTQAAQTVTINVTSLPSTGANYRKYKTLAPGATPPNFTGNSIALTLGLNTLTVGAVTATPPYDRTVKFQFSDDQFEFDAISLNGVSVYGPNTSLSNLTAETTYDVYVQADCGATNEGVSSWTGPISFTTTCTAVADVSENFNAATTIPNCFGTLVAGGVNAGVSFSAQTSGNNRILLKKFQSTETATLLLPPVTTLGSDYRLKFRVANLTLSGSGVMNVGTVDANGNFTSFQEITITNNQFWETQSIDFSSYTGTDVRVAITGLYNATANAGSFLSQTLIDNVVWEQNPACVEPSALVASNITSTSADITWTSGYQGNVGDFNFEYGTPGFTPGTGTGTSSVIDASTTIADNPNSLFVTGSSSPWLHIHPFVITADGVGVSGLEQTYTINVTSLPATGVAKMRLIYANTPSGSILLPGGAGQPLVLGLNTLIAPAVTWNRFVKAQFNNNTFGFDAITVNGVSIYNGATTSLTGLADQTEYYAYVQSNCGATNGLSSWFGPISFTTLGDCNSSGTYDYGTNEDASNAQNFVANTAGDYITLTFTAGSGYGSATSFYDDKWYITDGLNGTGNVIASGYGDIAGSYESITGEISFYINSDAYNSTVQTDFVYSASCTPPPSCPVPIALVASNLTDATADISWTLGGTETIWNFEYGVQGSGFTPGTGSASVTASVIDAATTIAAQTSLFVSGPTAWPHVYPIVTTTDGVGVSGLEQTFTINVTSLPATGVAKMRLIKQGSGGGAAFQPDGNGIALVLGINTFTASAVSFNRYVKIQFNSGAVGFDAMSVNGTSVYNGATTSLTGLTAETTYDVYVQADCGFGTATPDESSWVGPFTFTTPCSAVAAPYIENFDALSFPTCWSQSTTDDGNWTLDASGTTSGSTGPSDDMTGSGNYLYIETSTGAAGSTFELITQTIDLSALTIPQLRFYSHMYGATIGTLNVDVTNDNGATYTNIFTKSGDQGDQWNEETVLLSLTGTVSFKITGIRGSSFTGDIAIDNFEVRQGPCPVYSTTETITECVSYTWQTNNVTYTTSQNVPVILQAVNGCDSTVTLDLTITDPSSSTATPVTACDSLQWNGTTYTTAGAKTFTTTNAVGCDSVVTLQLSINNSSSSLLVPTSQCNSYDWNGTTYTTSGVYVDTLVNAIGCPLYDSLDLTIINATSFTETPVIACDSYLWNGNSYTTSDTYTFTTTNSVGCDSTVTLDLTINNSNNVTETPVTACDSYTWNGTTYTTAGAKTFTTTNAAGCDSVVNLQLTINSTTGTASAISSCNSYIWNGTTYTADGEYYSTSVNSSGCPQKDTLNLTITTSSNTETVIACDSYSWNGITYTTGGDYENVSGTCKDSLLLTINSSSSSVSNLVSCDSLEWNGLNYLSDGNYTYITTNSVGCDSTATLNLTINSSESNSTDTVATACDSIVWNGSTYTTSGTKTFTTTNVAGCDSILKLILTINNSTSSLLAASQCNSYDWNGNTYSTSGIYVDTLVNSSGCSQIDSLDLTITNSSSSVSDLVSCDSLLWNGLNYSSSGTYTYTTTNSVGCDSTATLNLTINNSENYSFALTECDHYIWNGDTLTSSGVYVDTLQTTNTCDSVVSLNLTILNSYIDTVNAVACLNYTWNGNNYTSTGNYTDTLTSSVTGCDSIVTLSLTINLDSAPYLEDFASGLPSCWINNTNDALNWSVNSGGTASSNTGPSDDVSGGGNYIYIETSGSAAGDSAMLNTGYIDLSSLTSPALRMYTHMYGGSIGELSVWVTDASGTMTQVFAKNGDQGDLWVPEYIDLSAYSGIVNFTILGVNSQTAAGVAYLGDIAIDNFEVMELPICLDPYGLTASNVLSTTADISWINPSATVTSWNYVYDTAGFNPLLGTPVSTTDTSFSLTGLNSLTSYDVYIQSNCGANVGTWLGPLNFSTLVGPGTCGFFTVDLLDSFGDGWSGNGLIVNVNGVLYDTLTISTGANAQYLIPSDIGDVLDFNYVIDAFSTGGNTWVSENSYTITNSSGIVVANETYDGTTVPSSLGLAACAPNDLSAYAAIVPSGCDLSTAESLEFWVVNTGTVAESAFDVAYVANGGTQVIESITSTLNPSDTLKHVFTTTVDMSADGMYNVDFVVVLTTDSDSSNNTVSIDAENYLTPTIPTTMGDTICTGDTAYVEAEGDGYIYWYDAATGGNLVDEGDIAMLTPSATTSYYAEVAATGGFEDDFESYTAGDSIAQTSNVWEAWSGPDGGGADDAVISNAQASSGSNSLYLNNADGDDLILPFGDAYSSGKFYYSMNMYIVTDAYFNFQADENVGTTWAFDVILANGVIDVEIAGDSVLQGAYSGTNPAGAPVWINVEFEADLTTGVWELFTNGNSQGTFTMTSSVASVNLYANTGNEYYIDDVEWGALTDDACRSGRTEAVVTVEDCSSNINELSFRDLSIYPNPNNGQFTITNSQDMTEVIVTDLHGKIVYNNTNVNSSGLNIIMDYLERGIYMINIKTENDITTKTIVVQ